MWPHYAIEWRFWRTRYRFAASNPDHTCAGLGLAEVDGVAVDPCAIPLHDDGGVHDVAIVLGAHRRAGAPVAAGPPGPIDGRGERMTGGTSAGPGGRDA
jgi:hypothetical protein